MIPRAWARAVSFVIVISLLTSVYVITDLPTMEVKANNHSGIITVNETWSGTGSHFILGNVTIPENITVIVEPGAVIEFEEESATNVGPLNIFVNGTFILNGTPEDPITVTSRAQVTQRKPGDWGTIYYNATSNDTASKVSYTKLEFGTQGLFLEDTSIFVENTEVTNMSQEGIVSYASSPVIRNCTLHYNNFGIWAEAGGEPLIQNNTIEWNMYDGIYAVSRVNPTIIDNNISNNIDDGIHILAFNSGLISNNTITYNRDMGLVLNVRADILVQDNNISRNFDAGIWIRAAGPTIHHNLITNNTRNGVRIFDCKINEGCPQPKVLNNTIAYNNKESGLYPGIFVESADPLIMNNYIAFNDAEGIYLRRDSGGNISSNAIINNEIGVSVNASNTWIVANNPISGNVAGIYVKKGEPLIRDNVITNNKYGIYTFDDATPRIYRNVISSASGKDVLVGDKEGKVTYFQNRGESVFKDLGRVKLDTGADVEVTSYASPSWGDIDNDGLDDLIVGEGLGYVYYFHNLGNGYFEDRGRLTNETPVTSIGNIIGTYCNPFVTDWDLDGDLDLFCGTTLSGHIYYFTNNGDNVFTGQGRLKEGGAVLNPGSKSAPFFYDWNGDGDRDLIVGNYWGDVKYYENSENTDNKTFTYFGYLEYWDGVNPPKEIRYHGNNTVPWLVDWDNLPGTDLDLITSNETGAYLWRRFAGDLLDLPVQLIDSSNVEINARAVDWNSDGYHDLIVGGLGGYIKYYRNDGTDNFQQFQMKNGTFGDLHVLPWASPFPIDFDGDSILDLIIGDANGDVWFFRGTAEGSPVMEFVEILRGSGTRQFIKVGGIGFGMSSPFSIDWNSDDYADLIVGETNGWVWLFTNDADETFSSVGRAHNETGAPIRTLGMSSAPSVGDWDGDMLLDLIVGDMNGYVYFWKRRNVVGDTFNFTNMGKLWADGKVLKVSKYANPYVDDWNADGDLDLLVGEESGRVMYYENNGDGTLTYKGNLTNILGGDLKVSNNSAPQGVGYHGSIRGYKGGIGIYCLESSPKIENNIMIKGGDGNRTEGEGETGGVGIYLVRSNAIIRNNKNISGGSGGLGLTTPTGDVVGGMGGHGIYLDDSTGFITDNIIIGGMGGPAEAASDGSLSIGGEGGSGIYSVNNTTTTIINNIIIAGDGNVGINATGGNGSGVKATNNSEPYIDDCLIKGGIGVYADNSTPFIVNSTIEAYYVSFNVTNNAHAIALNTTFDRTKTYYGDEASVLETQWFLNVKVLDRSGFQVPETTITIERDGLSFMGHLSSAFAPLATTAGPAPTVVDWDEDGDDDLIVGENDGDVQWYKNQGDDTYQTPPITLLRGSVTGMGMTRPYVYDLDFDGEPDIVLGDSQGRIYWYKRNGTAMEFYSFFNLTDGSQYLGDVNVTGKAAPAVGDWTLDGYWDLVVGDQTGYVQIFERQPGTFLNFTYWGVARMTDGTPARTSFDAIPHVTDWNGDDKRDLILASVGQVRLYLSCENGTLLWGGPFYANRSGLNPILVGGFSSVTVLDYNGDGDLDLLVGATNNSLPDTGNIEYFESNRNGDSRTYLTDEKGELDWIVATEFIESDKNGNHFGNNPGDKVYYTPHSIKAKKNIDIGCASPEALMTESRDVVVTMCRDVTLPRVVSTYPAPGQVAVPVNQRIQILFSKPMNNNSVIGATTVYSDFPSEPTPPYDFLWEDDYTKLTLCVNYEPSCPLRKDTHYTIRIRGTAEDQLGMHLDSNGNGKENGSPADDYVFSFHTETLDKEAPTAVLTHWPMGTTFVRPLQIVFDAENSTDNVGIVYWEITVDNGGPLQDFYGPDITNATTPPVWFNLTGNFCANLTVWDAAGLTGNDSACVEIITVDNEPPVANAGPDQLISIGQNITFDGSGSYDNVTQQVNLDFNWTFWNGSNWVSLSGMLPTYSEFWWIGDYVVTLKVTDEAGNWALDNMTVTVTLDSPPKANAGPPQSVCAGDLVTLNGSGTTDDNPIADSFFNWTFNDGTGPVFLQGIIVTHPFAVPGDFIITLNVTDVSGNWNISTTSVKVTLCIKPMVIDWRPIGPDQLANVVVRAKFSKNMAQPWLTFSFTLKELDTGAPIVGLPSYNQFTYNFTYTPFAPLDYGITYRACFNASVAMDTDGFYLDGNGNNKSEGHPIDDFCWNFRTANPPSVGSISPYDGETNVPVESDMSIAFSEPMDSSSVQSAFVITDGINTWDNSSTTVTWSGDLFVFTFSDFPFEFSKKYNVTINSSIAKSAIGVYLDGNQDGIPMGSMIDDYTWSFTTEPTPTVTGTPTGTDIPLDANIVMIFNKIMDWSSVKSAITIEKGIEVVDINIFGATSFDNVAKTFSINPIELENGVQYTITLSGDLVSGAKDLNGNSLDGNMNGVLEGSPIDDYSFEFITIAVDNDPPQVVDNFPLNGAAFVPLDTEISITFNELMNYTMLLMGIDVKVNVSTYGVVSFVGEEPVWNSSSLTVVLTPIGGLDYDTKYTVIVSGSFYDGVEDLAGNSLDGDKDGDSEGSPMDDHRFVFTTPDPIPPYVVETSPDSDEDGVLHNTFINATFDDVMDESTLTPDNFTVKDGNNDTVSGQLIYDAQGKTLSFDPDQNLRPGMTYTVTISNVMDSDENLIAEPYVWSFTTALDYDPPVVTIIAPPDGYTITQGDDVLVYGTAFDNSGIQSLLIQIGDGSQIDITERYNPTNGSWNYTWDTGDSEPGVITVNVTAYDLLLLSGSDEVNVEVEKKAGEDITWLILVIFAVILAAFATLLFLFMWRKRRQAAEDELIAEEVRKEMWEEREEEEALEEVSEPVEAAEAEEEPEEELDLDMEEPARRIKK